MLRDFHCTFSISYKIRNDVNGEILRDGVEYFEQVLNMADVREANIDVVGNFRMPVLGDLNERAMSLDQVGEAVN